jgi:hypothetical protein
MTAIFPSIKPTARSYTPGRYPQTFFQSINGATSVIQFGAQQYNSELTLSFVNIDDDQANGIIKTYEDSNGQWGNVEFRSGVMDCVGADMAIRMKEGLLRWRFAEPPTVTYKFRNLCDVQCSFIAYLDGT